MNDLILPYGGKLVDLFATAEEREELFTRAENLCSIQLNERQFCDLELLGTGAFSPLDGFMNQADYQSVLDTLRLCNGYIFPIPITLSIDNLQNFEAGQEIVLRDSRNEIVALMEIAEIYEWDREELADKVFGTTDSRHPLVAEINRWGKYNEEIVKHGGMVICAAISPYRATRDDIRNLIGTEQFIEIYVQTPIEVCEQRDVKGMYAQARQVLVVY